MSENLEAALRRAVGLEAPEAQDDTQDPQPATPGPAAEPPALNSDQLLNKLTAALGINEGN